MRTIIFFLLMGVGYIACAQTLPPRLSGKPQPVGPNIRYYRPPDLEVTSFSVKSIVKDVNRGAFVVTVSVGVRNIGELPSNVLTTLKCFYADASGTYKPPANLPPAANDHGSMAPWTYCAAEPKLPIVKGGQSWGGDLTFEVLISDVRGGDKFYLILLADFYNNSKESNERNNYSTPVLVTPPNH
ncbi:hypothetical protein Q4E93_29945 [Flavitalea sp. BT771]|uniref:hypothetical protein n=1 Tax=Flavitalea sp. BT771 TaxID=3063329 RepID=UPI0026E3ADB1|nr:hypothetical protein [Flavitalea sp. BT771]MDO6434873.1 hypothetical protein [Flavitalea sp. BT771]MDV6223773.1 hypothetical protein [Flavitalea sp. BT771]